VISVQANVQIFDRFWLHIGRKGREKRYKQFPASGRVKSVYRVQTPDGEMEQTIVHGRDRAMRPPGRGWRFFAERPRFMVWRRTLQ
jgi:hypothetical protein